MAKINISVSSDSSKPSITISKGPVGPQGEQGIQGIEGPQGPAGTVLELSAIPDVILPSSPFPESFVLYNALVWQASYNNGAGRWTYLGAVVPPPSPQAPPPNQAFVYRAIGENFTPVSSLSSDIMGVGVSGFMPNDVSLYVDGDSRFNGGVEIASGGAVIYALPTSDGTAGQVIKTNGSGVLSFGSLSSSDLSDGSSFVLTTGAQLISGSKIFSSPQSFTNGISVTSGGINVQGNSSLGIVNASSISTGAVNFLSGSSAISTVSGSSPEDLSISSNGNIIITLDSDDDQTDQEFKIKDSSGVERFKVVEDGSVKINNAYTLPTSDSNPNYFLKTDGSGQLFFATVNGTSGNVGASPPPSPTYSLDDLTDVDTTTVVPTTGQALVWDGVQWEPGDSFSQSDFDTAFGNKSIDALSDVDTTTSAPSAGQALVWSGSQWAPGAGSPWTTSGSDIYYNTGNVGVGTTTPSEPLHVEGDLLVSGSTGTILQNRGKTGDLNDILITSTDANYSAKSIHASVRIGQDAGRSFQQSNQKIIAIGTQSLQNSSSGGYTIAIGFRAAKYMNGQSNVTIGNFAGSQASSSTGNSVFIGENSGNSTSNSSDHVVIGMNAGYYATTGAANTLIGRSAGQGASGTSTFANTVAVGYQALTSLTTGAGNTAVGYQAADSITTAQWNTAIGYQAGASNITGSTNTFVGYQAGLSTVGFSNTYIGSQSGQYAVSGGSTGVGNRANYNAGGFYNTGVGHYANDQVGAGEHNSSLGAFANFYNSGSYNVAVGYEALMGVISTTSNSGTVAIGYQALKALTTGGGNTAVGYQADSTKIDGANNTAIGYNASTGGASISNSTAIGYNATSGVNSIAIGPSSTANNVSGRSIAIGVGANSLTYNVIAIGYNAGPVNGSGNPSDSVWIGNNAGNNSSGNGLGGCVGVGSGAGSSANSSGGVFIGGNTGGSVSGSHNIFIGRYSGSNASGSGAAQNVFVGSESGKRLTGARNVGMGYGVARSTTTGTYNNNVFLGHQSAYSMISGDGNVFIGYESGSTLTTESNKLYIENSNSTTPLIYGEFDNDILRVNGTLQVNDPASTGYAFPTATGTLGQVLEVDANGDLIFATPSGGGGSSLWTASGSDIYYTTGNVGIGTTTPGEALDVVGNIKNDGQIVTSTASGNSIAITNSTTALTANYNTLIGINVGRPTTGTENTMIGNSLSILGTSSAATMIGRALTNNGGSGVMIGKMLTQNTGAGSSVLIGYNKTATAAGTVDIGYGGTGPIKIKGVANDYGIGIGNSSCASYGVSIGTSANVSQDMGVAIGHPARTTNGVSIGGRAGQNNSTGTNNTLVGVTTGYGTSATFSNVTAFGHEALRGLVSGNASVGVGYRAGRNITTGLANTIIGTDAGYSVGSGGYNVFVGYQAGYNETGSNKLYIENSNSTAPLIYGEFDNDLIRVNGDLEVKGYTDVELGASETFTIHDGTHDLFQVDTSTTGTLFSVNDVSGLPMFQSNSDGTMALPQILTAAPTGTAPEGTMQLGIVSGTCYLYVYINGGWKSTTLA